MKILHIETGKSLYGGALQVYYLLDGLRREGVSSVLLCDHSSEIRKSCESTGIPTHPIRVLGELDPTYPFQILRAIRNHRPDCVHIHSRRGADFWGGLAAKIAGIPCILSRRVDNPEPRWAARLKYSLFSRIITISDGIRQVLLREGIPSGKIRLARSAVDFASFPQPVSREVFLERFALPSHAIVIAVAAQLIPRKGHRFLLEALPPLMEEFPSLHTLILGKGASAKDLRNQVDSLGIGSRVHFSGFVSDLKTFLPHVDILAHPALMEGLGIALVEATWCRVPIVASAVGGIPEIVRPNENGLLVPPGDSQALLQAIRQLLRNPADRLRLGETGHRIAETEFAVHSISTRKAFLSDSGRRSIPVLRFPGNSATAPSSAANNSSAVPHSAPSHIPSLQSHSPSVKYRIRHRNTSCASIAPPFPNTSRTFSGSITHPLPSARFP
jgi:glycosyltransferase involved in cell wall biosynthesis